MKRCIAAACTAVLLALLPACEEPSGPDPAEGVDSAPLSTLLREHWDLEMRIDPFYGSWLGAHQYDDDLPHFDRGHVLLQRAQRRSLLTRAQAMDPGGLSARDRVTHAVLVERLTASAGLEVCDHERWWVLYHVGYVGALDWGTPIDGPEGADDFLIRVRGTAATVLAMRDEVVAGARAGKTAPRVFVEQAIGDMEWYATRPTADAGLIAKVREATNLTDEEKATLEAEVTAELEATVTPAYAAFLAALVDEVLPRARTVEGLHGMPQGLACYDAQIRNHTGLDATAQELHQLGLGEITRIEAAMIEIGRQRWGATTLAEVRAHLEADPALRFGSRQEVIDTTRAVVERARRASASLFAAFPKADLVLEPYAEGTPERAAMYGSASADGSTPAYYYFMAEAGLARWNVEPVTFHETFPGHHMQVGRAIEMAELPAFRRFFADTVYDEGWGLYAERLALDVDLYSDEIARLGALSNEAFRACRLVVDTGLHALGWTRAEAEAYMQAHSLQTAAYIRSEVQRYLRQPGQALAYKVGQLEFLRMRAEAQAALGTRFSLRDFHEVVLAESSVPMPVMRDLVSAWIAGGPVPVPAPVTARSAGRAASTERVGQPMRPARPVSAATPRVLEEDPRHRR